MLDAAVLIPALPLAGFVLLALFGKRFGDPGAGWLATLAMAGSFVATLVTFVGLLGEDGHHRAHTQELFTWMSSGDLRVTASLLVDPLSITMALFVTGVGTLIHLYSVGYMHGDDRYPKFFVYMNLFAFSMLVLVLADSFLLSFLGWEGVGACSYLLVSFWFERNSAAVAGKKAFVTNRVGDVGFLLAMFLIFGATGSLRYSEVFAGVDRLPEVTATAIALLLFVGACGKSAQLPLFVWLPDAMEGPTPVSALIHAATMVTAGVYLMARVSPILALSDSALTVIAVVGAATALFAATVACAQNDIKRVLAYSTVSQLGYMFLAVGCGAYVAAIFHMVTHAFFKALLFLGSGSVIHGLHDEQDMKRMGGLRRWMPITAGTFIVGWLAISGIFPFAGFWSKDDILLNAWQKSPLLWAVGAATALLTAYYMTRQVRLVFYGQPRWQESVDTREGHDPRGEEAEHDAHAAHAGDPHESPWTMAVPLVTLAALSVVGGFINLPFGTDWHVLETFLHPVFGDALRDVDATNGTKVALAMTALVTGMVGIALGWRLWSRSDRPELEPAVLRNAWGIDNAYAAVIDGPGRAAADGLAYGVDKGVVDGGVNGVAAVVQRAGGALRHVQTGYVRNYALTVAAGTVLILGWAIVRAVA